MATKIIYIGVKPSSTTGLDVVSYGAHTPATLDQNFANLQSVVDSKAPLASPSFTGDVSTLGAFSAAVDGSGSFVAQGVQHIFRRGSAGSLAEVGRFDTSGNLLVGVTSGINHAIQKNASAGYVLSVNNTATSSPNGLVVNFTGAAPNNTTQTLIQCADNASLRFMVFSNGNVQNINNSYGAISDIKLKENVDTARDYLADICRVRVVKYSLKADASPVATHLGVIAQELEEIFPGMVETTNDTAERPSGRFEQKEVTPAVMDGTQVVLPPVYGDDFDKPIMERYETGETTKGVKYSVFVPMLIRAVQELSAKVAALEAA